MLYTLGSGQTIHDLLAIVCKGRSVFALTEDETSYHLVKADEWDSERFVLGDYRPIEPLKSLVFKPRESLGQLLGDDDPVPVEERIVVGVKNCDLSALRIHDFVFLGCDPADPAYKQMREKTVIVSCDCSAPCDVCFCTAVNEQPFPEKGFDINIGRAGSAFTIESGSARGDRLLEQAKSVLHAADDNVMRARDTNRTAVTERVAAQARGKGLSAGRNYRNAIAKSADSKLWEEFAVDCVECGACNFICCTCHCFLLADGFSPSHNASRIRQWDSCLYLNFARVAGGANPRKHRAERLHNRFDKKFNYFPQVLDTIACDGCGRCITACTGKIDIRDVLKKALYEAESV